MMQYPVLIILISIAVSTCLDDDSWKCYTDKTDDECEEFYPFLNVPKTVNEIRTMCRNMKEYFNCTVSAMEDCNVDEDKLKKDREIQTYSKKMCDENYPIYQTVINNLECMVSNVEKTDCRVGSLGKENNEIMFGHLSRLRDEGKDEAARCLELRIASDCRALAFGYFCNNEVRDVVQEVLDVFNSRNKRNCSEESIEETQSLYDDYPAMLYKELESRKEAERRK